MAGGARPHPATLERVESAADKVRRYRERRVIARVEASAGGMRFLVTTIGKTTSSPPRAASDAL
jgi:hypothetical protein